MAKSGRAIHPRTLKRRLAISPELKAITKSDALIELFIIHWTGFNGTAPEQETFNCIIKAQQLESWLNEFLLDSYWAKSKLSPHDPVLRLCQYMYLTGHITGRVDITTIENERLNLWQLYKTLVAYRSDSAKLNKFENFIRRLRDALTPGQMTLYLSTPDGNYKNLLYGLIVDLPPDDDELPEKFWIWTDKKEILFTVESGMMKLTVAKELLENKVPKLKGILSLKALHELSRVLAFGSAELQAEWFNDLHSYIQSLADDLTIQNKG